ncbi:alpha/beta hydrolase [Paenibacillus marinisediminis]
MQLTFDFPVTERTYKVIGDRQLKLYIFEPKAPSKNKPAILFFNGGSFKKKPLVTPVLFQHQANYLSSKGMVAICVDYRNGSDEQFTPIQAIMDVKSAVRWVREHSDDLGVDPNQIVVCGSSAGGYIAVSSIMFEHLNDDGDNQTIDHIPNALVVFGAGMDGVDIMSRRYPELLDIATELSPIHNIKKCLPPTLWMCGTADDLYEQNQQFVKRMVDEKNDISFITYEGMGHDFFHYGKHEHSGYHESTLMIADYLKSLSFI